MYLALYTHEIFQFTITTALLILDEKTPQSTLGSCLIVKRERERERPGERQTN